MVLFMAYVFLRQSFTTVCDYLINTRAKGEGGGWIGMAGADIILTVLEGIRFPM